MYVNKLKENSGTFACVRFLNALVFVLNRLGFEGDACGDLDDSLEAAPIPLTSNGTPVGF